METETQYVWVLEYTDHHGQTDERYIFSTQEKMEDHYATYGDDFYDWEWYKEEVL